MIVLKHALHGVKNCYSESEAISDEKNGWQRFTPEKTELKKEVEVIEENQEFNEVDEVDEIEDVEFTETNSEPTKKRGRPAKVI